MKIYSSISEGPVPIIGFFCLFAALVSILLWKLILFTTFLFSGMFLLTLGSVYVLDFSNNQIKKYNSVFMLLIPPKSLIINAKEYDLVEIKYKSEVVSTQFRTHVSKSIYRDFIVVLSNKNDNEKFFQLISYDNYKNAFEVAKQIKKNWNYELIDNIREKVRLK